MRLDIGMLRAEELFGPLTRQTLNNISKLAAAVITLAGISLSVLVGKDGARSLQDCHADKVL
jgi:hypothetical protein